MAYKVQKRLQGEHGFHEIGEIVDAENWKNVNSLLGLRYLVVVHGDAGNDTTVNKTVAKKSSNIKTTSETKVLTGEHI